MCNRQLAGTVLPDEKCNQSVAGEGDGSSAEACCALDEAGFGADHTLPVAWQLLSHLGCGEPGGCSLYLNMQHAQVDKLCKSSSGPVPACKSSRPTERSASGR